MRKEISYQKISKILIVYLVIVNSLILTKLFFYNISQYPQKSVLGFTYPPSIPDFSANSGGVKTLGNVTIIVESNTFSYDSYLWVNPRTKTTPVFVDGYFQISDMYDTWIRKQSDNSKVVYPPKKYILSFGYQESWLITDQGILFPESSIKIAHANTHDGEWELLSTVIDRSQNTAATVTDKGGFFMLVAGFGTLIPSNTPTPSPTLTPSSTPIITPTKTPTPTPAINTPTFQAVTTPSQEPLPNKGTTPTIVPQKITFKTSTVKRKDFFDRIIDAILLVIFNK